MNGSLLSSRLFRMLAVILVIFLGILIGLPYLIKQQARMWLEDNGGDRVEIRDVDFNPFTAELDVGRPVDRGRGPATPAF